MTTARHIRAFALTGATLLPLMWAGAAHAGFEWSPVPEASAPGTLTPMVNDGPAVAPAPVGPVDVMPTYGAQIPGPSVSYSPAAAAPVAMAPASDNVGGDVVQGFGSDLPLALALGQVVPARFGYSFGAGVDPAARVNWNGGRSWFAIVQDMVRPLGLSAQMGNTSLIISRGGQTAPAAISSTPVASVAAPLPVRDVAPVAPYMAQAAPTPIMEPSIMTPLPQSYEPQSYAPVPAPVYNGAPCLPAQVVPQQIVRHATAAKPLDLQEIRTWTAPRGSELLSVLTQWTDNAGGTLYWNATGTFIVPDDIKLSGTFPEAVAAVLSAFDASTPRPVGKLHPNAPKGPAVLVVEDAAN